MIPFKSIRVCCFDIGITKLKGDDLEKCLGMFYAETLTIGMREKYHNEQQEAETLLHELFHAICAVMGLHAKDREENRVHLISVGMASVIRDNPKLIKWLQEKLR